MLSPELQSLGLYYQPNFITSEEEQFILEQIPKSQVRTCAERNNIWRYGSSVPYSSHMASKTIPKYLEDLCERLVTTERLTLKPDSVTINEYLKNQVIKAHIDSPTSGEIISIISLLSEATINFKFQKQQHSVVLGPRSLVQMQGEIRNKWMHEIFPVQDKRFSIVFRCSTKKITRATR